jgi:hypothetical protein
MAAKERTDRKKLFVLSVAEFLRQKNERTEKYGQRKENGGKEYKAGTGTLITAY